jgi:ArsR family metal-binding transcriptional regulator
MKDGNVVETETIEELKPCFRSSKKMKVLRR